MKNDDDEHMAIIPLAATKVATIYAQGYVFDNDSEEAVWIGNFAEAYASFVDYAPDNLCAADYAAFYANKRRMETGQ